MTPNRMLRFTLILFPLLLAAQTSGTLNLYPGNPAAEQNDLNQAVNDAAGSAVDLTRLLEAHLRKYPNSPHRSEIESTLYRNATDAGDRARIIQYGDRLLLGKPANELEVLERVIRTLLSQNSPESDKKALAYAFRYEAGVAELRARPAEGHATAAQWVSFADRALSRATVLEARATGNLGNPDEALRNAKRSWDAAPSAESAHEIARWLVKLGREAEAIDHYADAVTIDDPRSPWADRDRDRKIAIDLYTKIHGSSTGVAEVFELAWDRTAAALRAADARYRAIDRNYNLTDLFDFVLPPVNAAAGVSVAGPSIAALRSAAPVEMAKLKGKTVVIDFWATWCTPCIAEYPLIQQVKQRYAQDPGVVFLSLNADDDHTLVAPFLAQQKWDPAVYLEDGLAGLLNVTSLPTVLVIDPQGAIRTRITGYNTASLGDMIAARIDEARAAAPR